MLAGPGVGTEGGSSQEGGGNGGPQGKGRKGCRRQITRRRKTVEGEDGCRKWGLKEGGRRGAGEGRGVQEKWLEGTVEGWVREVGVG